MAEFSKLIITKKGQALIAKILTGKNTVEFTKIASSSSSYELESLEELTVLENIKQTSLISSITKTNETAIKAEASFTNTDLTEGYYMRTLGLYSVDPEEGEILYAVTVETSGNCYMPPYNGVTVSGAYIQLVTSVGNAEHVSLEIDPAAIATIGNIQELKNKMETQFALNEVRFTQVETQVESHIAAKNNPHQVTKEQIGLGEVDNTNDLSKPVSTATQDAIEGASVSNKQYVDRKVAELVNGAPEALDTLLELANAFNTNQELVDTLSDAIGKKANQTDLASHQNNNTLHITAAERSKWNTVDASLSATSTNPIQNKVVKTALDQQNVKNSGFESSIGELNSNLGTLTTNGAVTKFTPQADGLYATYKVGADTVTKKLGSTTFAYFRLHNLMWNAGTNEMAAQFNFRFDEARTLMLNVQGWFLSSHHGANYYVSTTKITMMCAANTEYYIRIKNGDIALVSII